MGLFNTPLKFELRFDTKACF